MAAPLAAADLGQQGADWTGFYLGAHGANYSGSASSIVSGNLALTFDGSIPGVHFGYDHDFGRLVVGGEVAGDFGGIGYHLT